MQVIVGYGVGLVFGLVWFCLGHFVFAPYLFPRIVQTQLAKYFMIRDSGRLPNVLLQEYNLSLKQHKTN